MATNKSNKLGTFGGVFTPSILTILGVIMFMRAGYVIGEAGIIHALLILFIFSLARWAANDQSGLPELAKRQT